MAQLFTLTAQQDFINLVLKRQAEMRSNHVHRRSEGKKLKYVFLMFLILCSLNTITKISSFDLFWAPKLCVTFVGNWTGLSSIRNLSILDDREVLFTLQLREKDQRNMKKQIQQSFLNKGIALWVNHSFWPCLKMSFLVGDPFEFQFSLALLLLFLRASEIFLNNVFMSKRWKKPSIG